MKGTRRGAVFALTALLAAGLVAQVLPFLLPCDPGPLPPEAERLAEGTCYARPLAPAALAQRLTACFGLGLLLLSGWPAAVERRWGGGRLRWPARLLFLAAVFAWLYVLGTPFAVAKFMHMRAFGLSELTAAGWWRIKALSLPVPVVKFLLANLLVYCCLPLFGRRWWIAAAALTLLLFHLLPEALSLRQPLDPVETLTPLEAGPFREALQDTAVQAGAELDYYVVDQSERSRHVNMYLTGRVGREYVVITDNLFGYLSPAEAAAILAHELGHGETRHLTVPLLKVLAALELVLVLGLVHLVQGRRAVVDPFRLRTLVLIMLAGRLLAFGFSPVTAGLTRYRERTADRYALDLTGRPEAFVEALYVTSEVNLVPYELPAWVYWMSATHPSVKSRVAAARAWAGEGAGL